MTNNEFLAIYETSHIVFYINDDTLLFAFNRSNGFICMFWAIIIILEYAWNFTVKCTFYVEPLQ